MHKSIFRAMLTDKIETEDRPESFYREGLFRLVSGAIKPTPVSEAQLKNITVQISTRPRAGERSDVSELLSSLVDEVQTEYLEVTKMMGVGRVLNLANFPSEFPPRIRMTQVNRSNSEIRTGRRNFFESRRLLTKRLLVVHPIAVLNQNFTRHEMPSLAINIDSYRFNELPRDLDDVMSVLEQDIRERSVYLAGEFSEMVKDTVMCTTSEIQTGSRHRFVKHVISYPIHLEMQRMVLKSLDHIVHVFGDELASPKLKFKLKVQGTKCISVPSVNKICDRYYSILKLIDMTSVINFPSLENHFNVKISSKSIAISQSRHYLSEKKHHLTVRLNDMFGEFTKYMKKLDGDFSGILDGKLSETISVYLQANDHTYVELLDMLGFLHGFKYKASRLVDRQTFELGSIDLVDFKNQIRDVARGHTDTVVECAVAQLLRDHQTVDASFDEVAARAVTRPADSEELFALDAYMSYASTAFMEEKTQTVKDLIVVACDVSAFAKLPAELWRAQTASIERIRSIKSVFYAYAITCEEDKSSAQETVARVVATLDRELDAFDLTLLDRIDDVDKLFEYKQFANALQRKIDKFNDTAVWIDKEHTLFNKQPVEFAKLNEINNLTRPFFDLIAFSYRWTLKKKLWTRGNFDELSSSKIEIAFDDFYKEALKIQKQLKIMCKKTVSRNPGRNYQGLADDPDMNLWPAPLKIAHQTIESMDDFQRHLPMIRIMCDPALTERHWQDMSEIAGVDLIPNAGTTLEKMIDLHLEPLLPQFEEISKRQYDAVVADDDQ